MHNQCRNPQHQELHIKDICCAKSCSERLNCLECLSSKNNPCKANHPDKIIKIAKLKQLFKLNEDQNSQFSQFKNILENIRIKAKEVLQKMTSFSGKIINLQTQLEKFVNDYLPNQELIDLFQELTEIVDVNDNGFSFNIDQESISTFFKTSDKILISSGLIEVNPDVVVPLPIIPQPAFKDKITLHLHEDAINYVAISPDSRILATSSYDKTIKLTDLTKVNYPNLKTYNLNSFPLMINNPQILCLAFSENSELLASGGENLLLLWAINQPKPFQFEGYENSNCSNVVFNKDYLISGGQDIKVWNIQTKQLHHTFQSQFLQVTGIVANNQYIISLQINGYIKIWDLQLKKLIKEWKAHPKGQGLSLSFDQQTLVSNSTQGDILFWDLLTILQNPSMIPMLQYQLQDDQSNKVYSAKLSKDNKILVSCGSDNKSKVWDIPSISFFAIQHINHNNLEKQRYNGEISNDMKYIVFGNMKYVDILVAN